MKTKYDFRLIEISRHKKWLDKKYFQKEINCDPPTKTFTVLLPPPNITGKLHLGHAWNNVLQDIIIRRKRMMNFDVLFLPGMDHAGIATQKKIKEQLKEKGFKEKEITRDLFLKYVFTWKEEYSKKIRNQWKMLGLSLNYEYEKFTLDKSLSDIVEKVFIKLYKKKMIYQDYKIINWDIQMKTTLSNIEVKYQKISDKLFYLKYFLVDNNNNITNNFVEVATTRPETIFVDQALMVNPKDSRYQGIVGKKVIVPISGQIIKIISDNFVDIQFGTGILKVTPAHDENDFKLGKKYFLNIISCIKPDGKMDESVVSSEYGNINFLECRQKIVHKLKESGFLVKMENYDHLVGFSIISGSRVEPILSLQWFLKTKETALLVLKKNKINFFPKHFKKVFENWLTNLEDWCISRQLWWGHPIPVWYKNGKIKKVQKESPGPDFKKDPDVLDTWFSSSLWPLSTLNWSDKNNNSIFFKKHFPTDLLVTGYDILTFWVSRMVLQSICLTKKIPFKNVLLHGLVKDSKGQKMSKSKGNGINPIEIMNKYGTDSLRWFLVSNSSLGSDLFYNEKKIISSWNFINKLFNISCFIKKNVTSFDTNFKKDFLLLHEKFLLTQLSKLIKKVNLFFEKFEFSIIGNILNNFIWEDLSNWFLEFFKLIEKKSNFYLNSQKFLMYIFKNILQLLHPFIPFLTDKIYNDFFDNKSILISKWPNISFIDTQSTNNFQILKQIIVKFRFFRQFYSISKNTLFKIYIKTSKNNLKELEPLKDILKSFLGVSEIKLEKKIKNDEYYFLFVEKNIFVFIEKEFFSKINDNKKKQDFIQQKEFLLKEIERSKNILNNPLFLKKAKKNKIYEEKKKYKEYLNKYEKLIMENNIFELSKK
ncbi:valyl-tRNA synthetase [Candidatus Phytoplasma oryzae]|uniref:Valine--tRNA ligase n=1 Tax=Candidatus Phytoplasma oryzae TaxID=203274 RepID=A0A328IIG2_9MOLU|nr:valyl-tRNA synthetase [Candidatus Phytoplasma oryzae]